MSGMGVDTIVVLDFEATCADKTQDPQWQNELQEIVEFPAAVVTLGRDEVVEVFHSHARPVRQPRLSRTT